MTVHSDAKAIQGEVDRLIDERPGLELMEFPYDEAAVPIVDGFVYRSGGTTASYMVVTDAGRLIVNTGMGFEAPHHKALFDAVYDGPTPYVITTQAHVDHVGGVAHFREPGTRYVAQASNPRCQADDARIQGARAHSVDVWFGHLGGGAAWLMERHPGALLAQDRPTPDVMFDRRLALRIGDLDVECISTPGGETVDACVVWLPQHRICFISNLVGPMFPHFPNFNTLRGDKYRFVEPYLESVRTVRALQPEILITGRNEPIRGAALVDACLGRLHDAVDFVHRATLDGINAGTDIFTLMREIQLPDHLRVGQEYGRVSWAVRTIWESYLGWFRLHSTTELYPVHARDAFATAVDLVGAEALVARAREQLDAGEPVVALHLVEAVLVAEPDHAGARDTAIAAHERLLADGEDANFWARGWLEHQVERLRGETTDQRPRRMRTERANPAIPEVVLDHPPVNALRSDDFLALADAVTTLGRDPATRVIILRSDVEKAFAAGVDVHEMTEGGSRAVVAVTRACAEAYGAIAECEVPVIAAVYGYCLATGVGIAGNADIIVASDDAVFGLPEVDRGGLGTATQLQSLVPPHKARFLAYSCARIPATELARYGTVERVVPRAELLDCAREIAATIAAKSPLVIRRAKESLRAIEPVDPRRSFRREMGFTFELNLTPVADEARAEFLNRESPSR